MNNLQLQKGQLLVELLITMGLAAVLLPALLTGLATTRAGRAQQDQRQQATLLVRESREAVRVIREKGWGSFAINGSYHPVVSGTTWALTSGSEQINGFTRQILISDVYRDPGGAIVTSGGAIDSATKKIVTTASWSSPFPTSVTATEYVTRYINRQYTETTAADFNAGTKTGVTVTNENGGEVQLGAGGSGNWCAPSLSVAAVDLPKNGVANAITAIQGHVFAGTGDNASGISFAEVAISNPPQPTPPAGSITGTFDGFKTNGVFGEAQHAYLATDNNSKEIVIIDLTQKEEDEFTQVGYFNAPGNGAGNSIYVANSVGYMTDGSKLYTFDLSGKSGARPLLDPDGVTLIGAGKRVVVRGNYAFVAVASATTQIQIIDATNPSNLTIVGQASLAGQQAVDVYVNSTGTRAYVATLASATEREFFIVDVSTKTGNRPTLGSYDTQGMSPKSVTLSTNNKAIIGGTGAEEYQVIDVTNEDNFNLPRCGGINIDTGVNGVATVVESDGDAYAYVITGDATTELKIIEGGPGGQFSASGTFESQTFDASMSAQFNSFVVTQTVPSQTALTYQVGIAQAQNGSCNGVSYTFVGPDITSATYFASGSALPTSADGVGFENPGQCIRYRAYESSSDVSQSPSLNDIRFSYSP